jgi:hypothetical protein
VWESYHLDLDGSVQSLLLLGSAGVGLSTHDTTTPVSAGLLVLVGVAILDGLDELGELSLVLGADLGEGEDSCGLLVDNRAETGLALDYGVWDTHLAAEGGQEDNELDGVDIVGDQDKGGLLVLNETNNVVETVLDGVGLLGDVLLLLALLDGGGLLQETLLLLGLGLRTVLVEELESLGSGVAVQDVLELSNRRWDLQAEVEDLLLALKTDILGPSDHAREVAFGLDVLADTEVTGALLDERVLMMLAWPVCAEWIVTYLSSLLASSRLGGRERRRRGLLSGGGFWGLSLRRRISELFNNCSLLEL